MLRTEFESTGRKKQQKITEAIIFVLKTPPAFKATVILPDHKRSRKDPLLSGF